MGNREDLHDLLKELVDNVYYQPPSNISLLYPCIIYERSNYNTFFANNNLYGFKKRYTLTFISKDPDSTVPDTIISKLPECSFDRHFISQNLNHDIFNIFY